MRGVAFFKVLFILLASTTFAQITHPKASPYSQIAQYIGLTKISIEYSRPATRGRAIMGELVPFGRIWRVGANESTRFTVNQPIKIAGHQLEIGAYALYAIPNKDSWEIIIHGNTQHWGDGREKYKQEEDIFRFTIIPENNSSFQENFLISFDCITHNSAVMNWLWEHTKISIPITVDTHAQMLEEINRRLASNPSGTTYYEAARYLQEQNLQPKKALMWLDKAQELNGKTYYFHRVRSLVLASLEQYERAIQEANLSLIIADSLGKDEFVRMNEKNIEEWTKKL